MSRLLVPGLGLRDTRRNRRGLAIARRLAAELSQEQAEAMARQVIDS